MHIVHCTYIVGMRHTIKPLRNDTSLVNDVVTSAAHVLVTDNILLGGLLSRYYASMYQQGYIDVHSMSVSQSCLCPFLCNPYITLQIS